MTTTNGVYGANAMECLAKLECGISDAPFKYIGLSENTSNPTGGQTFVSDEIASGGGERKEAIVSYEAPGTAVWTCTFAFSESFAVSKVGVFDAPEGGNMLLQGLFSSVKNVDDGDELTIIVKDENIVAV